ncbi:unnamed protein product [Moneuplotes crassus]|uniref:Uncharacterized protein n=1 Tax=Euplotes crassus TaxID=5936 RepID=A0AAD1U997_EUPCR|nr:unnamed protein product [Moneuplotes crassus]
MTNQDSEYEDFQKDYQESNWLSGLFYGWATKLVMHVYQRKSLDRLEQCIQMEEKDCSKTLCDRIEGNLEDMLKNPQFDYKWGIIRLVFKTLKFDVFRTISYGIVAEVLQVINLFIISFYIKWIQNEDSAAWIGFALSFAIAIITAVALTIRHRFSFYASLTGINMRKSITALLFKKILKFNQTSLSKASSGKIVTIVSGELQVIEHGLVMAPYIIIAPIITILSFSLIAIDFGEAAAIGFCMFILIILCQAIISKATVKWKYWEGVYSDKRIKVISDIVTGIRTIKCYAWEIPFEKLVSKWRRSQLAMLIRSHTVNAIGSGIFMNGGYVIAFAIFSYHWAMGREFSYERSLSAIALLSYLSLTAIFFTYNAISNFATFIAIMSRVGEILQMEEYDSQISHNEEPLSPGVRVQIRNVSSSEGSSLPKIKNFNAGENGSDKYYPTVSESSGSFHSKCLNLTATDNQLVCIVGAVGSGKTHLLLSLMKELRTEGVHVTTTGSIAYVEQEPFIISGSIKDNILMGDHYDPDEFSKVLQVCCLDQDIANMEDGIDTEIGDRGVTISGGQKARISLARAVYSDADIYLLDDPLSAVDPEVAVKIFQRCINGFLQDKCRFLVTHQVQHLKEEKDICVIENKYIKYRGSYDQLREQGIDFDFILNEYENNESLEDEDFASILNNTNVIDSQRHDQRELFKNIRHDSFPNSGNNRPSIGNIRTSEGCEIRVDQSVEQHTPDGMESADNLNSGCSNIYEDEVAKDTTQRKGIFQKEEKEQGKVRIIDFFKFVQNKFAICSLVLSIFLSIICACLFISVSITVSEWTSDDNNDKSKWHMLFMSSVSLYVFVSFCRCLMVSATCLSSSQRIHSKMVWKLLRAKVMTFDSTPIGAILTRFSKDLGVTDFLLPQMANHSLITMMKVGILITFIVLVIPWNLLVLILVLIPMYFIRKWSIIAQNDAQRFESMSKGPLNTRFSSALDGITTIRAYKRTQYYTDKFIKDCDLNANAKFTLQGIKRWAGSRIDLCACAFVAGNLLLVTILVAFFEVFDKKLAALTVQFSLEFSFTANVAIRFYGEVENMLTSSQRMMEYANLESEDELTKPNDPVNFPETAEINFSNVHMRYQPHLPKVLKGLSYYVKEGQKIGIIGRTGSGKSSILQTIFRLVETEPGSQIIIGGEDIKDIGLHCLRNAISFIPQSPFLISSTIRANLDPFEVYSDEKVWRVLEEVQLKNYVQSLNDGLATEVTDQNIFSVGQKQLICLARAILRNTKILVLDEATANVDIETDSLIQRAIREKFKDCTVLTIAHRIATISDSDQILVMNDGKVLKEGSPDEVSALLHK